MMQMGSSVGRKRRLTAAKVFLLGRLGAWPIHGENTDRSRHLGVREAIGWLQRVQGGWEQLK